MKYLATSVLTKADLDAITCGQEFMWALEKAAIITEDDLTQLQVQSNLN